ncbi:MAG TPA: BTAD domain-containing putative transcriptional regulator [Microlunatus sp.]
MFVRLLGPVGAGPEAGEVAPVTGQVSAAVLTQLALADGRWVSANALVEAVWDEPPGSARNAIQVAVSRLRKQFGADLVLSSAHGYAVDPALVTTDWGVAERLVADSRRHLDLGDASAAVHAASAALELFRGEPLLGVAAPTAEAVRHRAHQLDSAAREACARALLALHQPDEAVAVIQPACEADPLNEPAQLLRIEGFAAAGRLAAALATYHQLRRALSEDLGIDPSPASQAVFARLLRSNASAEPAAATPPPVPDDAAPATAGSQLTLGLAPSRATAYQSRAVRDRLPGRGTAVLVGPSGVGKTQVAAGVFADSPHQLRCWVSASSPASIIAAYADAADAIQRVDSSRPEKDRARQFLTWLAAAPEPWLVVLDDVVDPADLRGWWPPESRQGQVLVTTQRRVAELAGEGREVFDVGLYSSEESLAYLRQRLRSVSHTAREARLLAMDLGHHPLALGLAAAVIIDEASSVQQYRDLLANGPLSASLPTDVRADGYPRSLQTAWRIASERADSQTSGAASRLLDVLAVLDPAGAPASLLDATAVQHHLDARPGTTEGGRPRARAVLRTLHQVSLTDHEPSSEPRSIRTHSLTGRLSRERASTPELVASLRVAAAALVETWPEFPTSKIAETLRGNATVVERLDAAIDRQALWSDKSRGLPALAALHGRSLMDAEQFTAALLYLQQQCTQCSQWLGPRHLDTIRLHNDIARTRSLSGDAGQARADLTVLLNALRETLGDDHPGTLITAKTLAGVGVEAGSPSVAVREIEAILPRLELILGAEHEVTLSALEDLANACGESGDDQAIRVYDELIERSRAAVGEDHRRTVILRADRAYWLGHLGDATASQHALDRLLPQMIRVLGPQDPNTLRARNNRAYFLTDHLAAFDEFTRLLAIRLEVLGPDHSDTLATRGNLANRRGMLGDAAGAAEDFISIVVDQERALGRENRFTLLCRGYQARWLLEAGETTVGVELGGRAVADLERVLGVEHPYSRRIKTLLDGVAPAG